MKSLLGKFVTGAGLLAVANAHAVMNVPEPYGFGSGLTNGPMTQAAFPCKKDEIQFTGGNKTTWSGGQSQPLHLVSAATHGGGSVFEKASTRQTQRLTNF